MGEQTIDINETDDEALAHNNYRYKENCVSFSWETSPEWGGYRGQGDYQLHARCKLDKLKHLDIYTSLYAAFACPLYCPHYRSK